jgi:hypothetical protein
MFWKIILEDFTQDPVFLRKKILSREFKNP